jgi:phosphatidate cytidylyltransferase
VTPVEGVRILGAKETPSVRSEDEDALDLAAIAREERGESRPSFTHRTTVPVVRDEDDAGDVDDRDRDDEPVVGAPPEQPSGEVPPLPHWTEPPTGAVPAIFADDTGEHQVDDELDVWAPLTGSGPRFRAEGSDWAEADYSEDLSGEHERLGALSEAEPVDEEAAFAEALEQRRRRPLRGSRAARSASAATAAITTRARAPRGAPAPPDSDVDAGAPRDLPTALMTAGTIVIVALVCFVSGPTATALLAAVIIGIASLEFSNALRRRNFRSATVLTLLASATLPLAAKHYGLGSYPIYFALIVVVSMLWFLWEVTPGRPLLGVAITVLGFAYIGGLGGFAGLMLGRADGVGLILGVVICTIAYDVVGFFVGSQFGHTQIAPRISPHKSVQGTVAGMLASVVLGWILVGQIAPWNRHYAGILLGLLVAFGAFLGDLSESMIKRDLGLKDFGTLLPGHGGVLDRFDSLLFCLPIAYYLAVSLKLG